MIVTLITIFIVVGIGYYINNRKRIKFKNSWRGTIDTFKKTPLWLLKALGVGAGIGIILFFLVYFLGWRDNRPTSPPAPIQYSSHSIKTDMLQTQHVSAVTGTGPESIHLSEEFTWQPGTVHTWKSEPLQKYWLPVNIHDTITVFIYTKDRSSHYMYQAWRDADSVPGYRQYDYTSTIPYGHIHAKLISDKTVNVTYTAYLK